MDGGFKLLLADGFFSRLGCMAVQPVCQQYFVSHVSSSVIANVNLIAFVLAFIVNTVIQKEQYKEVLKKGFYFVSIADVLTLALINFESIGNPELRFYAFAFTNELLSSIYFMLIMDMINYSFQKHELTVYEAKENQAMLIGSFIGGVIAIFYTFSLEQALIIQVLLIGIGSFCGTLGWYLIHKNNF